MTKQERKEAKMKAKEEVKKQKAEAKKQKADAKKPRQKQKAEKLRRKPRMPNPSKKQLPYKQTEKMKDNFYRVAELNMLDTVRENFATNDERLIIIFSNPSEFLLQGLNLLPPYRR